MVICIVLSSGREYPRYAIAAVGCVVVKDGKILLVKRGYPPREGMWAIPGGVIEVGETVVEAAVRELEEETGIRAEPMGVVGVYNAIVRDEDGKVRYHFVIIDILFNPDTVTGVPRAGGDAVDISWIPLEEVIKRNDVTGSTKKLVEKIIKHGLNYIPL
jgi:ADP-ribose pyrophosphatase YjhB (NUDIX family)